MTPVETAALVTALITLMGAIQAWLVVIARDHSKQLNGILTERIAAQNAAAITADHIARSEKPSPPPMLTGQARIDALRAELASLGQPPTV